MTPQQLQEFLDKTPLESWEKKELEKTDKRTDYFIEHIVWHRLHEAREYSRDSHAYLRKHGIFIHKEIKNKFSALDDLVWGALTEHEVNQRMKLVPRETAGVDELRSKGGELLKDLEEIVQGRLWNSATHLSAD
jgi:hypothetical protein